MTSFLSYVAKDLIQRFGNNLSNVMIVFPGKRARLYMNSFLSHFAQGPVWAPRFLTIDELFQHFSTLTPSDTILNVCRLYKIYSRLMPNPEPLDDFYGWGEILINDFDDIDKHMADADSLFTNAADLSALDNLDYLSPSQVDALRQFFTNFDPAHQTEVKRRFMELWKVMPQLYHQLNEQLLSEGLAYKGALYRQVVESRPIPLDNEGDITFCFVGFNVLDEVEEKLFSTLRDKGQALFYWDYDTFYAAKGTDNEAGLFLRHNLQHYPNALPDDIYDNFLRPGKQIRFFSSTTDNAQVRYLPTWIKEKLTTPARESAIILCDEALMRPVLHAIPSDDEMTVNITMGYPLTDTAIHGYFNSLIDLQIEGWDDAMQRFRPTALERLQRNPFFQSFPQELQPMQHPSTNLELIDWLISAVEAMKSTPTEGQSTNPLIPNPLIPLYAESIFQLYRILSQFRWLVTDGILDVKPTTLRRLIRQVLASATIPFHGEMDEGLQVMGLLEARNLDFRHIIMLSVGEGIIPRRSSDNSLIPYILRHHFGLDTTERQDAVYAYSFHRLLQRAEDITLIYNANSSGTSQREQSRFLRQLLAETNLPIEQRQLDAPFNTPAIEPIVVEKDECIMQMLRQRKSLSPTAINQFIGCPLKFYYQQIARLRMPDRPQDGIDSPHFGTIFHDSCEIFYKQLCEQTGRLEVQRADLQRYLDQPVLLFQFVDKAMDKMLGEGATQHLTGVNMIIREVITQLFTQLLQWDMQHTPFTIQGMEVDKFMQVRVKSGEEEVELSIGGRIDRMDVMDIEGNPTLRVVDYKTGREKHGPANVPGIFSAAPNAHDYYLQTFLYSLIMSHEQRLPVSPVLFYVLAATDPQAYDPCLKFGKEPILDISKVADEYLEGLHQVLSDIYDPTKPFEQTVDERQCQYCDFRTLCGR